MKLATYNVNGLRAALRKGLADWVTAELPDVLCLQEVKALPEEVDFAPFAALGYEAHWHPAQKKGYSGVATFLRHKPSEVTIGSGNDLYDSEGRVLLTTLPTGEVIMNVYMPSGTTGDVRQDFKYKWLDFFLDFAQEASARIPKLIICGDFNIAHTEIDIHNPVANKKSSGFLPEERAWMTKFLATGFTDAFRQLHPTEQAYSWWTYRAGARERNLGWRIDYVVTSLSLTPHLTTARMAPEAQHSDHCPVLVEWV
jgi:exodeoxyribonuclease-3